ncbi:MAG: hypothetical protein CL407_01265 [Acidimicrobiaceae bacterium]|nr:hypothetical protein [Acidimicrobiaceae bacterium]MBR80388.1 hypothetical protein [Acidimicrobiaceae bacterium]MEC7426579.1 hypothetical protein [Actinomycetota bacterium]MEC9089700.1 hypothetical protein [Actinomycetota bacterium]HAQ42378.1 hypothetical protein [Acidimicrobiaceae bacterium]|tara:strand:- start:6138 stop:6713 length:576 start_codon:yes stop_codon:yes gene_type:complete
MAVAVYPGSFNPPTIAHLAISEAAITHCNVDTVVWTVSRIALAKEEVVRPLFEHRLAVLHEVAKEFEWLEVKVTEKQLLADIALGYDLLIMGADKWHQIQDPVFYDNNPGLRDSVLSTLPKVAVAPREPFETPSELELPIASGLELVSSSEARGGSISLMLQPAQKFDVATGAWTDSERYERWLSEKLTDN